MHHGGNGALLAFRSSYSGGIPMDPVIPVRAKFCTGIAVWRRGSQRQRRAQSPVLEAATARSSVVPPLFMDHDALVEEERCGRQWQQ